MLIVSPRALSRRTLTRIDNGIEIAIISVLFQFPRNSKIITAVRQAAIRASRKTPCTEARTNSDWSKNVARWRSSGSEDR